MTDETLQTLVRALGEQLVAQKLLLATAESCTGGWVSKVITDIDGSSRWFDCALVTYSNQSKQDLLGVSKTTLEKFGAVSQPVVKEMVLGLLDRCNAHIGVSISGIAGPGGGTEQKPVGTVWMAWAKPGQVIESMRFQFKGDREQVRLQAVAEALKGVRRLITYG
ncbi:MAG: nicotinamide-nucleotide amidase [Pseudomonadota bacterium]|nr:nicotinamide-nucleotide amidase [Pseudomonadota bacterium]